jgi:hypothetical protein
MLLTWLISLEGKTSPLRDMAFEYIYFIPGKVLFCDIRHAIVIVAVTCFAIVELASCLALPF